MDWLISSAWAQAGAPPSSGLVQFLPLILIFVVFYFLLIRPQAKRAKEHKAMVEGLQTGDEVVASGGMLGRITETGDSFVTVEIADGVRVKIQRASVSSVLPKGTIKSA
jgi:preprotein translocase subunit YajC